MVLVNAQGSHNNEHGLSYKEDLVATVLLDFLPTATVESSLRLVGEVLGHLDKL